MEHTTSRIFLEILRVVSLTFKIHVRLSEIFGFGSPTKNIKKDIFQKRIIHVKPILDVIV